MPRPDVSTLLSIATFIEMRGTTTFREVAEHFSLKVDDVIPAVTAMYMTETASGHYFLDVSIDVEDDDDDAAEVTFHPDDVITAMKPSDVPSIYLTSGEAVVACHLLDRVLAVVAPGEEPAQSLVALREKLSSAARDGGVNLPKVAHAQASDNTLAVVWQALRQGRTIEADYHRPDLVGDTPEHVTITPTGVASHHRAYVGGLTGPKKLKWYRLDRLSSARLGPHVTDQDQARAQRAFKNHHVGQLTGNPVTLTTTRVGRWISESIPSAEVTDNGESLDITLHVSSLGWLRYICLMLGDDLLNISPDNVRQEITESARAILHAQRDFRPVD